MLQIDEIGRAQFLKNRTVDSIQRLINPNWTRQVLLQFHK